MDFINNFGKRTFDYVAALSLVVGVLLFLSKVYRIVKYLIALLRTSYINSASITYMPDDRLTPVSKRRLTIVARKILVLDMDETLIASSMKRYGHVLTDFAFVLPGYGRYNVFKRPYVDYFLDRVAKWYDLVIFTSAKKAYADPILDYLDNGRGILKRRFYHCDCKEAYGICGKRLSMIERDLSKVLLIDNSRLQCSLNVGNAVLIKSYSIGAFDEALLNLLPFLDALRFTRDVRSILKRNTFLKEFSNTLMKMRKS